MKRQTLNLVHNPTLTYGHGQVDPRTKECWNIRSLDYSFPGTLVPMMELSFSEPFIPWNIRSLDRSFPGTFVPENE